MMSLVGMKKKMVILSLALSMAIVLGISNVYATDEVAPIDGQVFYASEESTDQVNIDASQDNQVYYGSEESTDQVNIDAPEESTNAPKVFYGSEESTDQVNIDVQEKSTDAPKVFYGYEESTDQVNIDNEPVNTASATPPEGVEIHYGQEESDDVVNVGGQSESQKANEHQVISSTPSSLTASNVDDMPATGDADDMMMWTGILLIAMVAIVATTMKMRKENK